jgi:pimeloyl-ACP methyl ester carboxylesterase
MSTFVLVHGSWHGGWCWKKLLPELTRRGDVNYTPTLSGTGERFHAATPSTGLSVHVQDIANLLEFEDLRDVILVGHSYGGMVITGVPERTSRVGKLVYLDGIVPEHGDSVFSLIGDLEDQFTSTADANGMVPPWSPEDFGVTAAADVEWMKPRLTPFPLLTHKERLRAPKMEAKKLPRYFVHCTQFGMGGFAEKIKREGGTAFELNSGHDAMITEPKKLSLILQKIAADSNSRRAV